MQVAEILSDINSLRVCGHSEALALVNVHKNLSADSTESGGALEDKSPADDKADLRRAKELVELHYEVKARHVDGTVDEELSKARKRCPARFGRVVNCLIHSLGPFF
ncbi:hypothetical protein N7519_008989 [Penicillium mononematosum]|uniref:uncharacterized protein n=1 Tax=Penicillium mononematosum TaxID=268346 RepID=UPI002547C6DE|nr:uncharacterized protein N7519_008989 [Penicillium mononematosum]KAJ6178528.1 hypothetical protein N7519_008989 [Penicillium mononematosum]